ncbi:DeoR/GlpR family DNA-binding transcription regulator [Terrabacter sp. MAHUQ-38]|uniref:DeoR/GlpR family DNA-binding transcription regulator n=1 Tax=unclassified Terrabacter TaxID=2630222 RepID=UPI00165E1901|nr:DeoR/GlpR transcriptional regulator [Terrabacter sp. MAHUQ-38]
MTEDSDLARNRASRWSIMLDRLATVGRLGVGEASELLGVSEATIRRDFSELAKRQLVARNHGGVVATSVAYELPYRYRSGRADDDRARVAEAAAALVRTGQVIGLNGGTTTTATSRAITAREDLASDGEITIVTNALNIATEAVLRPHVQCVSLGGVARPESYEVTGPLAQLVLHQLWLDVAVVGVNGLSAREGATCRHEEEAAIIRTMIERSKQVICVATGEKLGTRTFASICPAERIDHLVTTVGADRAEVEALRDAGVEVHQV